TAVVAYGAVRKVRGTLRQHVGCNAHEHCLLCSCTPEIYTPSQQAFSPHIARGYTAQKNSQPVITSVCILPSAAWSSRSMSMAGSRWRPSSGTRWLSLVPHLQGELLWTLAPAPPVRRPNNALPSPPVIVTALSAKPAPIPFSMRANAGCVAPSLLTIHPWTTRNRQPWSPPCNAWGMARHSRHSVVPTSTGGRGQDVRGPAMPRRFQRSRRKGAKLPSGVLYIGRPTRWQHPSRSARTGTAPPCWPH